MTAQPPNKTPKGTHSGDAMGGLLWTGGNLWAFFIQKGGDLIGSHLQTKIQG